MGATQDTGNLRQARAIVSEKLRFYFAEIKAELDADSEDFFKRVMQQADQQHHAGKRKPRELLQPQQRLFSELAPRPAPFQRRGWQSSPPVCRSTDYHY